MVTTLTGENSFALSTALKAIVSKHIEEHGELSVERLDGQDISLDQIDQVITNLPLLASHKLVILYEPSRLKQFAETAETRLNNLADTTDLVIVEPKLDRRLTYFRLLKQKTDFKEFKELDQASLVNWLTEAAKAKQASLSPAAARYLIERVGPNQQILASELDKLLLYEPNISPKSIDQLTEPTPQSSIFSLLEAAFAGNKKRTLAIYNEQRELRVEPQQIIALLVWQLEVIAIVKAATERSTQQIAQEAKLNPFVVRKSQALAKTLSFSRLKGLVAELLKLDLKTRRLNIDPDEALQFYLLNLA